MNVIVIYHHPQECGTPYLTFISQESGQVLETVDIPEGYYDSGIKRVDIYTPVKTFTEEVNMSPMPTVDNVTPKAKFLPNPNHYVYRVTKVTDIVEDPDIIRTWKAVIHVEACTHDIKFPYSTHRDHFRKRLQKAGFNMSHWTLTKRIKTPFKKFLQDICSHYKDYHPINIIMIG